MLNACGLFQSNCTYSSECQTTLAVLDSFTLDDAKAVIKNLKDDDLNGQTVLALSEEV